MKKIFVAAFISVIGINAFGAVKEIRGEVTTAAGLKCKTTLRIEENSHPLALAMFIWGTGIYSNADKGHFDPAFQKSMEQGRLAVVSYDKPGIKYGISGDASIKEKLEDRDAFYAHVQTDLVDCAENTLIWASSIVGNGKIFLHGHSEGTEILTKLVTRLTASASDLLPRIDTVFYRVSQRTHGKIFLTIK